MDARVLLLASLLLFVPQAQAATTYTLLPAPGSASFDVSVLSSADDFVSGTCSARFEVAVNHDEFTLFCGVDRDDDRFITNVDPSGSTDPDGYDDDFVSGSSWGGGVSLNFCFRRDVDPNGDWDTISASVQPAGGLPVGVVEISVTLTVVSFCTPSGH